MLFIFIPKFECTLRNTVVFFLMYFSWLSWEDDDCSVIPSTLSTYLASPINPSQLQRQRVPFLFATEAHNDLVSLCKGAGMNITSPYSLILPWFLITVPPTRKDSAPRPSSSTTTTSGDPSSPFRISNWIDSVNSSHDEYFVKAFFFVAHAHSTSFIFSQDIENGPKRGRSHNYSYRSLLNQWSWRVREVRRRKEVE